MKLIFINYKKGIVAPFPPNNNWVFRANTMKKLALATFALSAAFWSCQNQDVQNNDQKLAKQAIEIHDEIMPQIPKFDQTAVTIDSILTNLNVLAEEDSSIDTAALKTELSALKDSIETATDNMMTWMKDYDSANQEESYQQREVEKISQMKEQFDRVQEQMKQTLGKIEQ